MKRFLTYASVITVGMAVALPAFAALQLPTPPPTGTNQVLTGSGIMNIITTIVNYLLTLSVIVVVAIIVWSGVRYAMGNADAKKTLLNAVIGLAIILGVGLIVNSVAALIGRGLNIG